jgi:GcrA cell cycle regulator
VPSWVLEVQPYVDDPGVDADIPHAQRRSLPQLNDRVCRWPVGDPGRPGFFFCGAPRSAGKPFCAAHCQRAYRHDQKGEGK